MRLGFSAISKLFLMANLVILLGGCKTVHPAHPTSAQQIETAMQNSINTDESYHTPRTHRPPRGINAALLPPLSHYVNPARHAPARFDVTANNMPAKEFFMSLVADTKYNMVVNPSISGNVSLNLKNVTIKETMDAMQDSYGFEYHKTSYGYEVLPPKLETQLYHINYLDIKRSGNSYTQLTTGQVSNAGAITTGSNSTQQGGTNNPRSGSLGTISSIETKSEVDFWKNIDASIRGMLDKQEGHSVTTNAQTGVIMVRAFPRELHNITRFVNSLQSSLNRQVILEAKILEIKLDDSFQAGVDWSVLNNPALLDPVTGLANTAAGLGQAANGTFNNNDINQVTQLNGVFALKVNGNFTALINLLQTQGNVQVLSSPNISTVNNQKAVIKVGQDEFFVTGVSTSNTIIGTNTLPSQDVTLMPFFSGITLDVTPEISGENTVILHIHPSVSQVTQQIKTVGLGTTNNTANNLTLPLAFSTIRESDNIVRAKNGQVVVIGGLMQNKMTEITAGVPGLSKIPFVGAAFRRTSQVATKSELIILLRPIVASNTDMIKTLKTSQKSFRMLRRPFHAGGLPKIFGNEAERSNNS